MTTQVDDAARRCRVLLITLRSLLECAAELEQPSSQIASALFLCGELSDALEKLANMPRQAND